MARNGLWDTRRYKPEEWNASYAKAHSQLPEILAKTNGEYFQDIDTALKVTADDKTWHLDPADASEDVHALAAYAYLRSELGYAHIELWQ